MANTGLLFVSNISKVQNAFLKAKEYVKKVLYIRVNATETKLPLSSKLIVKIYTKVSYVFGYNLSVIIKGITL